MKKNLLLVSLLTFSLIINAQTNLIDCNNVTYYEDTFYVSLDNNMISNTIYYNDSTSMIYPVHCLVLDDSSLISVSYHTGSFNTGDNCHIFTHLTQNSTRDTLDFDFEVNFNSNNFSHNTVINGQLLLGDVNSNCSTLVYIVLQNSSSSIIINDNVQSKELIKTIDLFGRETKVCNQPLFYIYDDRTVEKKIIIE
tara:strand:+ start:1345 stop:1929 length:585 start_codon:yes stop_codon:yes gene_type:complete